VWKEYINGIFLVKLAYEVLQHNLVGKDNSAFKSPWSLRTFSNP